MTAQDRSTARPLVSALRAHPLLWPLVTLALLVVANTLFNPGFLHLEWRGGHLYGSLVDVVKSASPLVLVSLGMTLVIATRGIDISVGAVVAVSAAIACWMVGGSLVVENGVAVHASRFPMAVAMAAALMVAVVCGAWNGALVSWIGLQPIIATLVLMVAGRGIAQLITGGQIITVYHPPYFVLGNGYLFGLPVVLYLVVALLAALLWLTRRTALGLFIEAVGINPSAARIAGVPTRRIVFWVYAFSGFCAGLAGLVVSSNVKSADGNNAGLLMELDAILAVTLGGTALTGGRFSLAGSLVGALSIQTLTYAIYSLGVPPEVNLVVKAAVVFVVMLLQSPEFRRTVTRLARRPAAMEAAS
jgi:simple sugar transport system permease protein